MNTKPYQQERIKRSISVLFSTALLLMQTFSQMYLPSEAKPCCPSAKVAAVSAAPPSFKLADDDAPTRDTSHLAIAKRWSPKFSEIPSDFEIESSRIFYEPLIPMNEKVSASENVSLVAALLSYRSRSNPEDISSLAGFIKSHPNSRWRPSLEANLAKKRFEFGYLTDALSLGKSAWQRAKSETEPKRKVVADQAISELVLLEAKLGLMKELEAHLKELSNRKLLGSVEQRVNSAREGLYAMKHGPGTAFKCGPQAVNTILNCGNKTLSPNCLGLETPMTFHEILKNAQSTREGTNLKQVLDWSKQVGLEMQMAKRAPGSKVIVPSIMHWSIGHFAAITAEDGSGFRLQDPTFAEQGNMRLTMAAIDAQSDGFFLVPKGSLPMGWKTVDKSLGARVFGKGSSTGTDGTLAPACPTLPLGELPECKGMARASLFAMNTTPKIVDTPLSYQPALGGPMSFTANYNYSEGNQTNTALPNLGPCWSLNWVSYLSVDASSNITVRTRGGGYEIHNYHASGAPYRPDLMDQSVMVDLGGSYQRRLVDGTLENFSLTDGTYFYLTSVVDPEGNFVVINWDSTNFRVDSIADSNGQLSNFTYVSNSTGNSGYYKLAAITDPAGRIASFAYDSSNTYLLSIVDAVGIVSKFFYDTGTAGSFIKMMTTPYGSTSFFQYRPQGTYTHLPKGLRVCFPDGSTSVAENWLDERKQTYYWDREATSLYPNDPANQNYSHCKVTRWYLNAATTLLTPVVNYERNALEGAKFFCYPGSTFGLYIGTSNKPNLIVEQLVNHVVTATFGGSVTSGDVLVIQISDDIIPMSAGIKNISYTVQPGDTLGTIASAFASRINADSELQTVGLSASANAAVLTMTVASPSITAYANISTGSPTETIAFNEKNPSTRYRINNNPVAGNVISITVTDAALSGGSKTISYTVVSGDTLASMTKALAKAVNDDADMQAIGVHTMFTTGLFNGIGQLITYQANFYIQSNSVNATTYSAPANIILDQTYDGIPAAQGFRRTDIGLINQTIDQAGRTFNFCYDSSCFTNTSNIDLLSVKETQNARDNLIGKWSYNSFHKPTKFTDGSGQSTSYTYNTSQQLSTVVDANGNTTSYSYNSITPISIGGSTSGGDALSITIGGNTANYTTISGDTPISIATALAGQINGLSVSGVSANASGAVISLATASGTSLSASTAGSVLINTIKPISFGGTTAGGDALSITVAGNTANYTTISGDNSFTLASTFASDINALAIAGVTATSTGNLLQVSAPVGTSFSRTTTGTVTITLGSVNTDGFLTQIDGPLSGSNDIVSFTWNFTGTMKSMTDAEGYTYSFLYDNLDRRTKVIFDDGTFEQTIYDRMDAVMHSDRLGRWSKSVFNSMDQVVEQFDPLGRKTSFCWCSCGSLSSLTDPAGNKTSWHYDLAGRVIEKELADQTSITLAYDSASGLPVSKTDELGQSTNFTYNIDNTVERIDYANAVNATASLINEYDTFFSRLTSTTNGWGQNIYSYNPNIVDGTNKAYLFIGGYPQTPSATDTITLVFTNASLSGGSYSMPPYSVLSGAAGNPTTVATNLTSAINANSTLSSAGISATSSGTLIVISASSTVSVAPSATGSTTATLGGGGRLCAVSNNVISNSVVSYSYDALGRTVSRMINGGNNVSSLTFDEISRVTAETNPLGSWAFAYVDNGSGTSKGLSRLESITYPNSQITNFSYYGNSGDHRLKQIRNLDPSSAVLSQFDYKYNPAGEITLWQQQQNGNNEYHNIQYDLAGQIAAVQVGAGAPQAPFARQIAYAFDCASNRTSVQSSAMQTFRLGGTKTTGDIITVDVNDSALSSGTESVSYTTTPGDTLSTIAAGLAAAITANPDLIALGVNAVSSGPNLYVKSASSNITTYTTSLSGGATETITAGIFANGNTNVTIGGTKTTGDVLTVTVIDAALSGGSKAKNYSVLSGDNLASIAAALATAINGDTDLSTLGVTASSAGPVLNIVSASTNVTNYSSSLSGGATETMTVDVNLNSDQKLVVGGSKTTSDILTIKVYDDGLAGGVESVPYTVQSGDTLGSIASGIATAINGNSDLQDIGVSASSSGTVVTFTSNSINSTSYRRTFSSGATETLSFSQAQNGTQTAVIGGSKTASDTVSITVYDAGLPGGSKAINYIVLSGDTLSSIATALAAALTADSDLAAAGISATAVETVVNITSTSVNNTSYKQSTSSGATETISLGHDFGAMKASFNNVNELLSLSAGGRHKIVGSSDRPIIAGAANVSNTATVSGSITAGDVLWISVHDASLPHAENVSYVVQSGDSATDCATGLSNAINGNSTLTGLGVTASSAGAVVLIAASTSAKATKITSSVSNGATETITLSGSAGTGATLSSSLQFSTDPLIAAGENELKVTLESGGGTLASKQTQVNIPSPTGSTFTFDDNGNLTSDGINSFLWDAEDRLLRVTYPGSGNQSDFTYGPTGECVKIVETVASSVVSTKQFIRSGGAICEERDGSGSLSNGKQFLALGQVNFTSGTPANFFYTKDHPGSVREIADGSGAIVAQYGYGPFGEATKLQGGQYADFQYAGYYMHAPSGLNLPVFRAYSSSLGRFINRDPIEEEGGINLYAYVGGNPIGFVDSLGLDAGYGWMHNPNASQWNPRTASDEEMAAGLAALNVGLALYTDGMSLLAIPALLRGMGRGGSNTAAAAGSSCPAREMVNPLNLLRTESPGKGRISRMVDSMGNGFDPNYPITVTEYNGRLLVVDGNTRAAAAVKSGIQSVPITRVEVSPDTGSALFEAAMRNHRRPR